MPGTSWYLGWAAQEECSQAGSLCSLSCPPISQGSYSQNSLSVLPELVSPPRAAGRACSSWDGNGQEHCPLSSTSFDSFSEELSTCLSYFTLSTANSVPSPAASELPGIITVPFPCPPTPSSPPTEQSAGFKMGLRGSGLCFPQECCCRLGLP